MNGVRDILEAIRALPRPDRLRLAEQLTEELGSEPLQGAAVETPAGSRLVLKNGFHVFTGAVDRAELDHRVDREERLTHLAGRRVLVAIDTSVLVARVFTAHEFHAPAKQWLDAIDRRELEALVSTHALAELYGVRILPVKRRVKVDWCGRDVASAALVAFEVGAYARQMTDADLLARIVVNPAIFGGKPIVRGRRLAVEHVLAMLAAGDDIPTILEGYPWLEREGVLACIEHATRHGRGEA